MTYETVIGLEVHAELSTQSKIFCGCTTRFGGEPNTHVCAGCAALPGTLPVLNQAVVEHAVRAGIVTNCHINRYSQFDRKNYFYPDLPRAYQVTQGYLPVCTGGYVEIPGEGGGKKKVRINRIHMEEDAGKLIHDPWDDSTLVDCNRGSMPLLEIVSEPDMRGAEEVLAYLEALRALLQYTGVSDCKMQEGSFRADVNLSVRPMGQEKLGVRTEIKNLNSFKAIARAIESERERHIDCIEANKPLFQETRRWDDAKGQTFAMRSKENAQDYKYFPDPDLPPVEISDEYIEQVRASLPELPEARRQRYTAALGLPEADTEILTGSVYLADLFEATCAVCGSPKDAANWILTDVLKLLNDSGTLPENMAFDQTSLGKLILMVKAGGVNRGTARKVLEKVFSENVEPAAYVQEKGLGLLTDTGAIRSVLEQVVAENEKSVREYKNGKEQALQYLIGQSMKALRGQAPAQEVAKLLKEIINGTH